MKDLRTKFHKYDDVLQLIMKLAMQQGDHVTRDNVSELLNINNSQAYRVLKNLRKKGN